MGEERLVGNGVREHKEPGRIGLCNHSLTLVWLELRVRWKPLEAIEWGQEGTPLISNHLNHLQVVTITVP